MPTDPLSLDDAGFPLLNGQPLRLQPKARAALALLLQRRPSVVSKDDFAAVVWPAAAMSDESLARCISQLRRALAPAGLGVDAVYGTGYRLGRSEPTATESAAALGSPPGLRSPPAPQRSTRLASAARADPATVDAFLHARQLAQQRTPEALARAIGLLEGLIARDPAYTPAHVALADALAAAVGWGQLPTDEAVARGLRWLDAAARQDPDTPGLDAARGSLLDMAWRFDEAAEAHAQALRVGSRDPDTLLLQARHLLYTQQAEQAVQQLQLALSLSPHAPLLRMALSRALVQAGRGAEAVAEAEAAIANHPGQLLLVAFALAIRAMVAPVPALATQAWRLSEGSDTPPFVWTVLSFVLARVGHRADALDIIDATLLCSRTTTGEATLYAAPLAALGETDRAAALLLRACDERCGMLAMVLRDPAHASWLPQHEVGQQLLQRVYGRSSPQF